MAAIYTMDGYTITAAIEGCKVSDIAIRTAERQARERGEDVHLVDDDGEWIISPNGHAERYASEPNG